LTNLSNLGFVMSATVLSPSSVSDGGAVSWGAVFAGAAGGATTTWLALESADPDPALFVAVTRTRSVAPTSATTSV